MLFINVPYVSHNHLHIQVCMSSSRIRPHSWDTVAVSLPGNTGFRSGRREWHRVPPDRYNPPLVLQPVTREYH